MQVFVSWSGSLSRDVAELLRRWIPNVLQGVDVWISSEDIEKGSIWFGDIAEALDSTGLGIICVTHNNKEAHGLCLRLAPFPRVLPRIA